MRGQASEARVALGRLSLRRHFPLEKVVRDADDGVAVTVRFRR